MNIVTFNNLVLLICLVLWNFYEQNLLGCCFTTSSFLLMFDFYGTKNYQIIIENNQQSLIEILVYNPILFTYYNREVWNV